jgi:hypothetical protein
MLVRVRRAHSIPRQVEQFLDIEGGEVIVWVLEAEVTESEAHEIETRLNQAIASR